MAGMPNKLATYPSGGLWLPVEVLSLFVTINDDDVVEGKFFLGLTVDAKCSYHIQQDLLTMVLFHKPLHELRWEGTCKDTLMLKLEA